MKKKKKEKKKQAAIIVIYVNTKELRLKLFEKNTEISEKKTEIRQTIKNKEKDKYSERIIASIRPTTSLK